MANSVGGSLTPHAPHRGSGWQPRHGSPGPSRATPAGGRSGDRDACDAAVSGRRGGSARDGLVVRPGDGASTSSGCGSGRRIHGSRALVSSFAWRACQPLRAPWGVRADAPVLPRWTRSQAGPAVSARDIRLERVPTRSVMQCGFRMRREPFAVLRVFMQRKVWSWNCARASRPDVAQS